MNLEVSTSRATHLVDVGGRFQHGFHVAVRDDKVTAWIPEQGRSASGPPKFSGRLDHGAGCAALTGVIEEARIDQFNAVLWFFLTILGLFFVAMGIVAQVRNESGGVLFLVVGVVLALSCTGFAVSGQRGRAETFARKASRLEGSLRDWARPQ